MNRFFSALALCALSVTLPCCLHAAETWADARLPVRDSLELWFDASRESAAREALALPAVDPSQGLDYWHDGSGHGRHLGQRSDPARPRWQGRAGAAYVRFDGTDDFLTASPRIALTNITVVILAAPNSNAGRFRAFLGWNKAGRNDYQSGFNVDLGSSASTRWEAVNVEGTGMGGQRNLLESPAPFGAYQTLVVTSASGSRGTRVRFNGRPQGARDRQPGALVMDELILGAREYGNAGGAPAAGSYLAADIAEVLIYGRVLADEELAKLERYLADKHAELLRPADGGPREKPLEIVPNAPRVQVLMPGFAVSELPLDLNNINNLVYAPDGRLFALGYDGNVWQLTDTDADGLEDQASLFYDNGGGEILPTIGMAWGPGGLYIPNKGRILRLRDQGNGQATLEVANSGWVPPTQLGGSTLDAVGIATDSAGNVYFGLGADKWSEPYIVDPQTGRSRYRLESERGAIIRLTRDGTREALATGLRWPGALEVHPNGDLFCLDQEGATWIANGNPFDELLHIESGRHYGFPPRHPKYLPDVIDEPSVFDYAPQHQSACSIHFNVPRNEGGAHFGPSHWRGDAFVTGQSRGKLWRTRLVKTPAGYVAQNQLIACLSMLVIDAVITPEGDLLATCHSGAPDWGTGPKGKGKLFKVRYAEPQAPQPLLAYAASPTETRVVFDRPLEPEAWRALAQEARLESGRYVSGGDRFESMRPGYQVVVDQMKTPRFERPILSAGLGSDGSSLLLQTAPRTEAVGYGLVLPWAGYSEAPPKLHRHPGIDLGFDLSGVQTEWASAKATWEGWLPHLDLSVSKALMRGSAEHTTLFEHFTEPGKLTLRAQLDLWLMLRPAIQPGATIDHEYAPERVTVVFQSAGEMRLVSPGEVTRTRGAVHVTVTPQADRWLPIELTLSDPSLAVHWFTAEDPRPRALASRRILVPWATPDSGQPPSRERHVPEIAGGNWLHGRRLYYSEQLACGRCHVAHGHGARVGPDLSNLVQRDYVSVMKDITQPNAAINPDHVAYNVELKDDEALTVLPVEQKAGEWIVADITGQLRHIPKSQIASMSPSAVSLMPEGLLQGLSEQQIKDLLTFLLLPPPLEPASIDRRGEPPPRPRSELSDLLDVQPPANPRPLRLIFCAAPKDHGPGEHDYPLWQKRWSQLLGLADAITTETADVWPSAGQFKNADVILFYSNNPGWNPARGAELDRFLERGGGLVLFHWAVNGGAHAGPLSERIGLSSTLTIPYRHGPVDLRLHEHPLTVGFPATLSLIDETYWRLTGDPHSCQLVGDASEEGTFHPQVWTRQVGRGRVFVSIPGHYTWTFDDPAFRVLALRGIAWAAGEPIHRFVELATLGARVAETE